MALQLEQEKEKQQMPSYNVRC